MPKSSWSILHHHWGHLPSSFRLSSITSELLSYWVIDSQTNWVTTPDFTWPPTDHSCSSSIVFQVIFHHLPGCHPFPRKYWVAKLLIKLSDCSSTRISLRWYSKFEVVFQVIFHHLPFHLPSCLPSHSPGQLPLWLLTNHNIFVYTNSDAVFFFCILNILVLVQGTRGAQLRIFFHSRLSIHSCYSYYSVPQLFIFC